MFEVGKYYKFLGGSPDPGIDNFYTDAVIYADTICDVNPDNPPVVLFRVLYPKTDRWLGLTHEYRQFCVELTSEEIAIYRMNADV